MPGQAWWDPDYQQRVLSAILAKPVTVLLQGSNPTSMLKEKLRAQLVHVAAAYSRCVLCIGGSPAFELSVMSAVDEIITLGRRCDLELCILTACSPAALEVQCHKIAHHPHQGFRILESGHAADRTVCSRCGARREMQENHVGTQSPKICHCACCRAHW